MKKNNILNYTDFLNESNSSTDISFEKEGKNYKVYYVGKANGKDVEFDGSLKPYKTGRSTEYKFEPDDFSDNFSEKYFDDNWEDIEEEILNAFSNK